jgi:hypothetical protein
VIPEAAMLNYELIIGIRNILLVQLVIMTLAPERVALVYQGLRKLLKSFTVLAPVAKTGSDSKSKSFWEIDMTYFEP